MGDGAINLFPGLRSEGRKFQRKKIGLYVFWIESNPQNCGLCGKAQLNGVQFSPCLCHTPLNEGVQHLSASLTHTHVRTEICRCVIFLCSDFSSRSVYTCFRDSMCLHPRGIYRTYIYSVCVCVCAWS